jgi:mono/diheme cytochrome c family protein
MSPSSRATAGVTLAALVALLTPSALCAAGPAAVVDFRGDVAPLLRQHCLACHGPEHPKGGLSLDTRRHALRGASSGPVLAAGRSAASRLVHVVAGTAEDGLVMPPRGKRLSPQQVGLLRAWIDQGVTWPDGVVLAAPPGSRHWAFQPLRRPALPAVKDQAWPRNPIDRFVLTRLERERIAPAPEADRRTLIRRVSFDLIGLPPTPAEVDAFLADTRPDAYERVVDRLLASPHYGERWARPWLDLCHYADTDGYLQDMVRPVAWRYRHCLIDALNRDLPFDAFTRQQLAGDLLPGGTTEQLVATGFLRNTLSNREGGADLEEFRVEQVVDRTMIVGTAFLGLTVGCARCHDHKFDPISQREFFQLYAFLDSADEVNVDAPLPGEREPYEQKLPEYRRKRAELLRPLAKEVAALQARWEAKLREAARNPGRDALWDRQWEVLGLVWGQKLGEGQLEGTQIVRVDPARRTQDQKDRLLDYFLAHGSVINPKQFQQLKLAALAEQLQALERAVPWPTRAPALRQTPVPRGVHVHFRGSFRAPGVAVEPGVPALLCGPEAVEPTRLGLARWLVSPHNPLTARVTVNRFWQEHFGRGLVSTPDDFGIRGEAPIHPELLDWLAADFRAGWRIKALHRLIVTSATYRQSSRARPELAWRDPHNRLLARQVSLRLSADQVRDTALAVSGLLHRTVGGPSVFPLQPASVAMESFDHEWRPSPRPDRYRRGLYTFLQRLSPLAQGVTFDAPSPSRSCARRERSNTPLQALTLLNDPVFFEAAQALAARLLRDKRGSDGERIDYLYRLCLSRPPTAAERERLLRYLEEQRGIVRREPASAGKLFPCKVEGIGTDDGAAWVGMCSIVLNLHELITRD